MERSEPNNSRTAHEPWGLYVHVPWCRARCPYCSFQIEVCGGEVDWEPFVARVIDELEMRARRFPGRPASVYLGGGTPSRLPPEALQRLIGAIAPTHLVETTAEANPEDITATWLDGALAVGVNRLSVGVQTLDSDRAKRLGRAHTVAVALQALDRVRSAALRSWSADLIFAVPGQTVAHLDADLDALLAWDPPHVSLYGLTFEPGTGFDALRLRGRMTPATEDSWRAQYDHLVRRLEKAGLERYEVSNFARPGHEAQHNSLYWSDHAYLGVGPSAHSYDPDGIRQVNPPLAAWLAGEPSLDERPSGQQAATDTLVSSLRSTSGLDRDRLHTRTGHRLDPQTLMALFEGGLLTYDDGHVRLTPSGLPVCDAIVSRLSDTLRPC